ncbi:hypothetical protein TWF506_009027 [Arthrobotrys conoides]|uniref:Uncharacterized protein n=1 Tax=Arthrobotrys conoides TaxID=74498 RepID=A0AAN8RXB8_9PEZI
MKLNSLGGWPLFILAIGAGVSAQEFEYKNLSPLVEGRSLYSVGPPELAGQIQNRPTFGAVHGKCFNITGETYKGEVILKTDKYSDFSKLVKGYESAARRNFKTQALYTKTPNCPISFCVEGTPWQYKFCVRPDIEDLKDIKFYRSEIALGSTWITWLFTGYVEGVTCEMSPPLPRKSDSEPILLAKIAYQKNFTEPRDGNPELLPWELQLWYGGCSLKEIEAANLKPYPPVPGYSSISLPEWLVNPPKTSAQSSTSTVIDTSSTPTRSSTTEPTPQIEEPGDEMQKLSNVALSAGLVKGFNSTELVKRKDDVPLEDRRWSMRCYTEPFSMPFQQNNNLSSIYYIKEKIRAGSLKAIIDYQPNPEGGCRKHYCDPSTNVKVSLCGEESISYKGRLYLPELIERSLEGLASDYCYAVDRRNITSSPKFYRVSDLCWSAEGDSGGLRILGPKITIGQLEAGISCDTFISRLQRDKPPQTLPQFPPSMPSDSSKSLPIESMPATNKTASSHTSVASRTHVARNTDVVPPTQKMPAFPEMPSPEFTELPYYLENFAKTGKGGNSLWLFNETEKTGGLSSNSTLKLQRGLYKNWSEEKFKTFENFPDFIAELPAHREPFEGDCTHFYCDDASKALISMCGKWWNGLPAPYADTIPPSYNVDAGRLIAKSRWLTYFCNVVGPENLAWINSCDTRDYNPEYRFEQSKIPREQRRSYRFTRGLVREFSSEGGMIGPSAFKVEHLSLYGVDNCYDWNQTLFEPTRVVNIPNLKILYWSGKMYENVKNSTSSFTSTPTASRMPSKKSEIPVSTAVSDESSPIASSVDLSADTVPNVPETTSRGVNPEVLKWVLPPPPTPVGPDRPDPTDKPQPEDPQNFRIE